jgi:uncharacterized protein with HEPN domain
VANTVFYPMSARRWWIEISPDVRNRRPEIAWRRVVSLRDVPIHDSMNVDLDLVSEISQETMPELGKAFEVPLAEEPSDRAKGFP